MSEIIGVFFFLGKMKELTDEVRMWSALWKHWLMRVTQIENIVGKVVKRLGGDAETEKLIKKNY
jgi:hypothetical protein